MRKKLIVGIMAAIMSVGLSMTSFAGYWNSNEDGEWFWIKDDGLLLKEGWLQEGGKWYYLNDYGVMLANTWAWIDGNKDGTAECYSFDPSGAAYMNTTTPDGYTVNADGGWAVNGILQQKAVATNTGSSSYNGTSANGGGVGTNSSTSTTNTTSTTTNSQVTSGSWEDLGAEEFNRQLFELINEYRSSKGIYEFEYSDALAEAATIRASECVEKYSHSRPNGDSLAQLYKEVGIKKQTGANENLACINTDDTPQAAFEAWKNSSGHNKNMLSTLQEAMAIGSYANGTTLYVAMNGVSY